MQISVQVSVEEKGYSGSTNFTIRDSQEELQELLNYTKSQLILISDQALQEEQDKGFDKKPAVIVDGNRDKNIYEVNPLGQIEFVARQFISDILLEAYNSLISLSKVVTGNYQSHHYVFLNGEQVATDLSSLENWINGNPEIKDNDLVRIVDIVPYARRLELLGVTAQRQQSRKVDKGRRRGIKTGILIKKPNGVYQLTLRKIQTKYNKNISVTFNFIPGTSLGLTSYVSKDNHRFKRDRAGKKTDSGRTYLYPSLVFKINKEGGLY